MWLTKCVAFQLISNLKIITCAPNGMNKVQRLDFAKYFHNMLQDHWIFGWGSSKMVHLLLGYDWRLGLVRNLWQRSASRQAKDYVFQRDIVSLISRYGRGHTRMLMYMYIVASASFSLYKVAGWEAMGHLAPASAGIWFARSKVINLKG